MDIIERARKLRPIIERAMEKEDDKTASEAAELYPKMNFDGSLIKAGTRINWKGEIKKAAVDLWDREENSPENAANLWAELDFIDGVRVIPEVITAEKAFSMGEMGFYKPKGKIYKSLLDKNVYSPEVYPDGWEEQK